MAKIYKGGVHNKSIPKGGSPGLVVMGDDSCSKGCGFESWCRIQDAHLDIFSH